MTSTLDKMVFPSKDEIRKAFGYAITKDSLILSFILVFINLIVFSIIFGISILIFSLIAGINVGLSSIFSNFKNIIPILTNLSGNIGVKVISIFLMTIGGIITNLLIYKKIAKEQLKKDLPYGLLFKKLLGGAILLMVFLLVLELLSNMLTLVSLCLLGPLLWIMMFIIRNALKSFIPRIVYHDKESIIDLFTSQINLLKSINNISYYIALNFVEFGVTLIVMLILILIGVIILGIIGYISLNLIGGIIGYIILGILGLIYGLIFFTVIFTIIIFITKLSMDGVVKMKL